MIAAFEEIVVVDASAVGMLIATGDAGVDALASRLAATRLCAPSHLPVEVDSLLRGLELGSRLTTRQAEAAREVFAGLPVDLWDWLVVADRAWNLRANLTSYDAGYVALAEHLGAVLLTADARIARAPGLRCAVEVFGT